MKRIQVIPFLYKPKGKKVRRYGIRVINTKIATCTDIDVKTLKTIHLPYDEYVQLESSVGNVYFNFK